MERKKMKRIMNKKGRSLLMTIVVLSVILIIMPVVAVGEITAARDISKQTVAPGETFTVTVTITASQAIYAPILDEDLPTNWAVTPLQNDGATFKESEIKWLWMESLSEGDSRTVVYNVTVPSDAESGVYYITGRISAYQIPCIDVDGESEINVPCPCGNMGVDLASWSPPILCGNTDSRTVTVSASDGIVEGVTVSKISGPSWLNVSPTDLGDIASGSSKTFTMTASPPSETSGDFPYSVRVSNTCGTPSSRDVTGTITVYCPELSYSPTSHDFGDMCEGVTDSTTFEIWNSETGTLTYTLSESCGWVDVNPAGGSSTGEHDTITVDIDTTGLSEGLHTCDISISSNGGSGTFTVTVNVVPCPELSYLPTSHDFGDMCEGVTDSTTFEIWNSGTGTLAYTLSESCGWVDVNPAGGSSTGEHDTITVDIDTTGLSEGLHTCDISIGSNDGSGTFTVTVNVVPCPELSYSPESHDFGDMCKGVTDSTTFEIWNSGTGTLTYTLSESCGWVLDVNPASGSSTGEHDTITVKINTTGLSEGLHTCDISIGSNGGSGTFTVTVNVVPCEEPVLSYLPTSHDFGDMCEGVTDSTTFEIWNSGTGTLTYTLSESCGWVVDVNPASGSSTGEHDTITVKINTTGLSEGLHTCDISIGSNGGSGTFTVTVNVVPCEEPVLSYLPTSHDFSDMCEGVTDSTTFEIWNSGTGTLTYTLSESCGWVVDVNPASGSSTGEQDTITVKINTTGLSEGLHTCDISIGSNGGSGTFTVTVNVVPCPCGNMNVNPTNWSPTINCGDSDNEIVTVSATGGTVEGVTVSKISGPTWLSVSPTVLGDITSGSSKTFTMTASPPSETSGDFSYSVTVSNTCGTPSSRDVTGTITVTSPCFIATAAYGTPLHEDINVLRDFRDEYMMPNPAGRAFVKIYYSTSPPLADAIRANEGLMALVREGLVKPLVHISRMFV